MKHLKGILRLPFFVLLVLLSSQGKAFAYKDLKPEYAHRIDSVISLSLLTCQPGEESWSLYGHTAIHYINKEKDIDVAVNYGMFNFHKPYFVLRFVFGLTDYKMGIQPFSSFCATYAYERRGIVEQELNLNAREKWEIAQAIEENYRPENREYRYNFFYDNCTTRARDILLQVFAENSNNKRGVTIPRKGDGPSFRKLIHAYTQEHPWARLGNDLLLGLQADRPTTVSEQQFLPDNLMQDFDEATILHYGGQQSDSPLVKEKRILVPQFDHEDTPGFPLSPIACAIILALLIVVVTAFEYWRHKFLWWFDILLLLVIGLCGLILTAMLFSQHPTVRLNLQILLLNPLALVCLVSVVKSECKNHSHVFWKIYAICLLLFLAGNVLQCYAEGTNILALSLLIRCLERFFNRRIINTNRKV